MAQVVQGMMSRCRFLELCVLATLAPLGGSGCRRVARRGVREGMPGEGTDREGGEDEGQRGRRGGAGRGFGLGRLLRRLF